jgi:hypothetical protein
MIKNKVLKNIWEDTNDALNLCISAEEQDPDFSIIRELLEQLLDEVESLQD